MSMMVGMRFLSFIMGGALSSGLFEVQLYGGLAMFMGYPPQLLYRAIKGGCFTEL